MSRTDAHTPYKYLPEGRAYEEERDLFLSAWFGSARLYRQWDREWDKHYGRWNVEQWYARQENRRERHNARAALRRGDYDAIPLHMTGRHSAAWFAY